MYATPQFVIFPHTTQGFGGSKWTTQPTSSIIFPFLFKIRALKKENHLGTREVSDNGELARPYPTDLVKEDREKPREAL